MDVISKVDEATALGLLAVCLSRPLAHKKYRVSILDSEPHHRAQLSAFAYGVPTRQVLVRSTSTTRSALPSPNQRPSRVCAVRARANNRVVHTRVQNPAHTTSALHRTAPHRTASRLCHRLSSCALTYVSQHPSHHIIAPVSPASPRAHPSLPPFPPWRTPAAPSSKTPAQRPQSRKSKHMWLRPGNLQTLTPLYAAELDRSIMQPSGAFVCSLALLLKLRCVASRVSAGVALGDFLSEKEEQGAKGALLYLAYIGE
ncbi:hypothetical protein EJ04DRAFT_4621 [Polyplosphaeria fusca]|uniref:Uncharacterized protein n=1 Tax=Polyplosphaeria fusca TaxID=682080 RepID=A0A9P4RB19_9PLEO|nr:hypothetical protein EJ04DRAFT_4621 [Polyplosphaeria fusca]